MSRTAGAKAPYRHVGGNRPGKSQFDISELKIFDADIGQLIPTYLLEVYPGDVLEIATANLIRAMPLVCPIYHKLDVYNHFFYVPTRLIDPDWEKLITGGQSGDMTRRSPKLSQARFASGDIPIGIMFPHRGLWDYFGFGMQSGWLGNNRVQYLATDNYDLINNYPWAVYHAVFRDYYRAADFQTKYPSWTSYAHGPYSLDLEDTGDGPEYGEDEADQVVALQEYLTMEWATSGDYDGVSLGPVIQPYDVPLYRNWREDYFTACLPWQQRGIPTAMPIDGTGVLQWPTDVVTAFAGGDVAPLWRGSAPGDRAAHFNVTDWSNPGGSPSGKTSQAEFSTAAGNFAQFLQSPQVILSATGITHSAFRFYMQANMVLELSARGGYRYNEYLRGVFGTTGGDARLNRCEYIGGSVQPLVISEVLQTSESAGGSAVGSSTPQGTMAGHGISSASKAQRRKHFPEHGYVIGIMSIMPEPVYQQGVPRHLLRDTRFDWYHPAFAHLSEQDVYNAEIYFDGSFPKHTSTQTGLMDRFGYIPVWSELREGRNMVCGSLAGSLSFWTLSRLFDNVPNLNTDFISTREHSLARRSAWAVTGSLNSGSYGQFLVQWYTRVRSYRPLPRRSDPGLLDHMYGHRRL